MLLGSQKRNKNKTNKQHRTACVKRDDLWSPHDIQAEWESLSAAFKTCCQTPLLEPWIQMFCAGICEVLSYSSPLLGIHRGTITESPFSPTIITHSLGTNVSMWPFNCFVCIETDPLVRIKWDHVSVQNTASKFTENISIMVGRALKLGSSSNSVTSCDLEQIMCPLGAISNHVKWEYMLHLKMPRTLISCKSSINIILSTHYKLPCILHRLVMTV